ncbi:hypothetical protein RRG08_048451 [Elysia crispata]|uniref:Uncharacterized protein n=1 Tax=Elysia crispata TaxID=231223 RepID=A0AAE1B8Q5_9GAST|nr:hypothetical protein RRG08_048451 [Elysia crispata]
MRASFRRSQRCVIIGALARSHAERRQLSTTIGDKSRDWVASSKYSRTGVCVGSNLRGMIPLDFESNALTTRPSQLMTLGYD